MSKDVFRPQDYERSNERKDTHAVNAFDEAFDLLRSKVFTSQKQADLSAGDLGSAQSEVALMLDGFKLNGRDNLFKILKPTEKNDCDCGGGLSERDKALLALIKYEKGAEDRQPALQAALLSLPDNMKDLLIKNKVSIDVYNEAGGGFFYDGNKIGLKRPNDWQTSDPEYLFHEIFHSLEVPLKIYSDAPDSDFRKAIADDLKNNPNPKSLENGQLNINLGDPPKISVNGKDVGFGDVCAEIAAGLLGQDKTGDPGKLSREFPELTAYLANKLGVKNKYAEETS